MLCKIKSKNANRNKTEQMMGLMVNHHDFFCVAECSVELSPICEQPFFGHQPLTVTDQPLTVIIAFHSDTVRIMRL